MADGDPSVGLREMPAFTLARRGVLAKPLHRAGPAVWGPQTGSSALGTLGSGLGVSSGGSHPERCRGVKEGGEQAGFTGVISSSPPVPAPCHVPAGPPGELRGACGKRDRVFWGPHEGLGLPPGAALIPLFSSSWLFSLVQKCSGWGRGSDPGLSVLEALAVPKASETKTFLRLHLEQEKVFPLGFCSSRKTGFYFCCLRQKNPLRSRLSATAQGGRLGVHHAGGLGLAWLSLPHFIPWGPWMLMLVLVSTKEKRFWCP